MSKVENPLSESTLKDFCDLCNWIYEVWITHRILFDDNPRKAELQKSFGGDALGRLSIVSQEYLLLQIAKLNDNHSSYSGSNLSIKYIVKSGDWPPAVNELANELNKFSENLKIARNKLIAHNDLTTIQSSNSGYGAFDESAGLDYIKNLEKFANLISESLTGESFTFNTLADNDAKGLEQLINSGFDSLHHINK